MCLYEIDVAIRLDGKTQTNFGHLTTKTLSLFWGFSSISVTSASFVYGSGLYLLEIKNFAQI